MVVAMETQPTKTEQLRRERLHLCQALEGLEAAMGLNAETLANHESAMATNGLLEGRSLGLAGWATPQAMPLRLVARARRVVNDYLGFLDSQLPGGNGQ